MRISRGLLALGIVCFSSLAAAVAQGAGRRPSITGISHISVYSADLAASEHFYAGVLGAQKVADPEDPAGVRYSFSRMQWVEVLPLPAGAGISRLAYLAWETTDAAALRGYFVGHGQPKVGPLQTGQDGSRWFDTEDPEGNRVQFFETGKANAAAEANQGAGAVSRRIIHVGMEVHNRVAEDRFYKGLLGFRPYWHGAMVSDKTDWISQQTPDGPDWLEYMMVGDGSTTPEGKINGRELGVLNHLSLGVANMEAAVTGLYKEKRLLLDNSKNPRHDGPQMGLDGKWQANLYDPDGTRVELMEFAPVVEPCCSPFTAASPAR